MTRDDVIVSISSRAFDILAVLASHAGEVVEKAELIRRVWPNTFVEEANLRVHIAGLRKTLGKTSLGTPYIANVPGRGYTLATEVIMARAVAEPAPPSLTSSRLPVPVTRVIGRDEAIRHLCDIVPQRRLVTIVGPGGIGKTTVALMVAAALASHYRDGVIFVDLSSIQDQELVPAAVAKAVGRPLRPGSSVEDLAALLVDAHALILLDNCEHLLDGIAGLAEEVLRAAPRADLLLTTREPLRAAGEWVHRLHPLDCPPPSPARDAAAALSFPAVELFVERASASLGGFVPTTDDLTVISDICRRLDGIALAIEFAAARIGSSGLHGLARSLDNRFRVLTRGRRTALPRHQTLRATLDWSYELLSLDEQRLLRRLGVFSGFSAISAAGIADDAAAVVVELLESLCAKSLVFADHGTDEPRYRLLETTRAYARDKLAEAGESEIVASRHAVHMRSLFERAEGEWDTRLTSEWLATYLPDLGNLRGALDWALSTRGDPALGVALTVAAVPFLFQLSLVDECLARVERALDILDDLPGDTRHWRMRLCTVLGWPQMRPLASRETGSAAWLSALGLARELDNVDYQLRSLWALWLDRTNSGWPREALAYAEEFIDLAHRATEPAEVAIGERMRARALHILGNQAEARLCIDRMLATYDPPLRRAHTARYQYDQRVIARVTRQRILWLQGYPEQAMLDAKGNIERALQVDHGLTLCYALSDGACPLALLVGDLDLADRYASMLLELTAANALDVWHTYAQAYRGEVMWRRGERSSGLRLMLQASEKMQASGFVLYLSGFVTALALALSEAGQPDAALAWIDDALARCEASGEAWCLPELHRVKGEILLRRGARAPGLTSLRLALDLARRHGAPAWELRAGISLMQHDPDACGGKQNNLLATIFTRFSEGADTADQIEARAVLAGITAASPA
ncbi:winged helix-turn-helix domain-containing protein [Bosea sp. Root381]|uniref:ATP-binding protein n=1 Tax=Bosea sp. Root381 TaxID=1736524 RepID=UPI0012E34C84|nr:winged helix-turn-helix domain-containing protein [Bosea sp. Root381]